MDSFERAYAAAREPATTVAAFAALSLVGYYKQFSATWPQADGWPARSGSSSPSGWSFG